MTYPTLPVEVPYTDIERDMIENEPSGMFPEDQNSYWGQVRKLFADYLQANALDLFTAWYNNLDPRNVDANDIAEWEERVGVPGDRSAITLAARRGFVQNRLRTGAFSRGLVNDIIETFLNAVLAVGSGSTSFGSGGIVLGSGGATLFSGVSGDPKTMYRVYYDYMNRTYYVRILNTLGEDLSGLTRELQRITPAGWSLVISDVANPLTYFREVLSDTPVGFWRLGANFNDSSGYGNTGIANGGIAAGGVASPGLLTTVGADNDAATTFDGVDDFISVAAMPILNVVADKFTIEAWVNATDLAIARAVFSKGDSANHGQYLYVNADGAIRLVDRLGGPVLAGSLPGAVVPGTRYHIVARKSGSKIDVFKNGVNVTFTRPNVYTFLPNTNRITIGETDGGPSLWKGTLDEVALYSEFLSDAQILKHYKTGTNVA